MNGQDDQIKKVDKEPAQSPHCDGVEDESPITNRMASAQPYSVHSLKQKRLILFIVAFAAMFSPLSSFIYYPALKSLASDLNTSLGRINLTITSYMVVSGIVPTMWGDLADQIGRRPVYIAMFTIYIAANVGLAMQRSYPALMMLRMLQSFGGSATVGVSYGIIGDFITPAERGHWMSIAACGPNVSPTFGPVFGGILAEKAGWPWIFWLLAMLASISLGLIILFYPETSRNIVGNGSIPAHGLNRRAIDIFWPSSLAKKSPSTQHPRRKLKFPNPLLSFTLFLKPYNTPLMLIYALFYTDYCILQASLSTLFITLYQFSPLTAGLTYIPFGAGCFLAALLGGRILNHDYHMIARKHHLKVDKAVGDDLLKFPVIEARFRSLPLTITLTMASMIPFGFVLEHKVHPAVPLGLQFVLGVTTTFTFTLCNTLLVDLHPSRPATAQASVNLIRCGMAGFGLAVLQPLIDTVGPGWTYVIFAGLTAGSLVLWSVEVRWGMGWWRVEAEKQLRGGEG